MAEVQNQPNIPIPPPLPQVVGGQPEVQVQQPRPLQGPPLRTPQVVLDESQNRFPNVDEAVLRGVGVLPGPSNAQQDMFLALARNPRPGLAPVLLGHGAEAKLALMPTAGVPGPNPGLTIQTYVREGQELYRAIMDGNPDVPRGKVEVAKVMWFLQALGSAKAAESSGQHPPVPACYKEGAFSLEDPDRRLETYLTNVNSYARGSSHLEEFQNAPGCQPRGVDIRGVPMPNERKTVLFARMPGAGENPGGPNMGAQGRLFLKMEPHGCRGLFTAGGTGRAGDGRPGAWKSTKRFFANLKDYLGHAGGFIRSVGQRMGLLAIEGQNNRERIPADLKTNYTSLQHTAEELCLPEFLGHVSEEQREAVLGIPDLLNRNAPLSSTGGVRVMIRNLEAALAALQTLPEDMLREYQAFGDLAMAIDTDLTRLRNHGDHPEIRIGSEVILGADEMNVGEAVPVLSGVRPGETVTQSGTLDERTKEIILAGYRYALANIDNRDEIATFEADSNRSPVHVGTLGRETVIDRDPPRARAAVLDLAGGNERIAKALMTLAHQGLAAPILGAMTAHGMKAVQALLDLTGHAHHISKVSEGEGWPKVFRVGYTSDGPMAPQLGGLGGQFFEPAPGSTVRGEIWLDVTFHENGAIEPRFHGTPSYGFTYVAPRANN